MNKFLRKARHTLTHLLQISIFLLIKSDKYIMPFSESRFSSHCKGCSAEEDRQYYSSDTIIRELMRGWAEWRLLTDTNLKKGRRCFSTEISCMLSWHTSLGKVEICLLLRQKKICQQTYIIGSVTSNTSSPCPMLKRCMRTWEGRYKKERGAQVGRKVGLRIMY